MVCYVHFITMDLSAFYGHRRRLGKMTKDEAYERAKKRVRSLKSFYGHLAIYVVIMVFLFLLDVSGGEGWWFYWAGVPWGLILAGQGIRLVWFGPEWEERKIREAMEREKEH